MATQIPPELTPAQAAALVTSGQKVYIGCCTSYARATKALPDGGYAESDWDDTYTSENGTTGKAPRTGTYLRIRAAYVPPSGVTIE